MFIPIFCPPPPHKGVGVNYLVLSLNFSFQQFNHVFYKDFWIMQAVDYMFNACCSK